MGSSASGALDATLPAPLAHPVFTAALQDLAAVGVQVSPTPLCGAEPYALIGGRSNARWWLLPLESGKLAASGLALFQPLLPAARWMKAIASWLSRARLQHVWARRKVYLSFGSGLAEHTGASEMAKFAFFTGTDSPHRKVAVQIMDAAGAIRGYAKITRSPDVAALLAHEAAVLRRVESLALRSALVPRVQRAGRIGNATVLVTDTLKTPGSRTATELTAAHLAFVRELAERTAGPKSTFGEVAAKFQHRVDRLRNRLSARWLTRLLRSTDFLSSRADVQVQTSLCHGDFTPWNTFFCKQGFYVFDWEYASEDALPGHDIAHFVLSVSSSISFGPGERYERARRHVIEALPDLATNLVDACMQAYLLSASLRYIERATACAEAPAAAWEHEEDQAALLDYALSAAALDGRELR